MLFIGYNEVVISDGGYNGLGAFLKSLRYPDKVLKFKARDMTM